jgi:hypothetical protein
MDLTLQVLSNRPENFGPGIVSNRIANAISKFRCRVLSLGHVDGILCNLVRDSEAWFSLFPNLYRLTSAGTPLSGYSYWPGVPGFSIKTEDGAQECGE